MTLTIERVMARPDGRFVINPGAAEVVVSLDPAREDHNAPALIAWLRQHKAEPYQPTVDEARAVAMRRMLDWIEGFTARFTAGIPAAELASWPGKAQAARAHLAGEAQPTIEAEAALRGIPATELAQKIAAKADLLAGVAARVAGLRGATEAAIAAADTPEAVQAALTQAQTTAAAMTQALGLEGADATL